MLAWTTTNRSGPWPESSPPRSIHLTFLANGPVAWVEEVMVEAQMRQSGIGRHLMDRAESWAQSRGAAYIALASRRAGDFYLALGYEDSATFFKKTLA